MVDLSSPNRRAGRLSLYSPYRFPLARLRRHLWPSGIPWIPTSSSSAWLPTRGLSEAEAAARLAEHGPNRLVERRRRSPVLAFLEQFTEVMVIVLIVAAVISLFIGETVDAIMILVIVILNAILGFSQEYRAERAMAALRRLAIPTVKVRRDGQVVEAASEALVPGDVIVLDAGMRVPADGRLLESANLRIEEAALTGESVPVEKIRGAIAGDGVALGDRRNMAYLGTTVTYGRGLAVVTGTGMNTELGHIATMLQTVSEERTPLQGRMAELGKWLAIHRPGHRRHRLARGRLAGEPLRRCSWWPSAWRWRPSPRGCPPW